MKISDFAAHKKSGKKISMVTCYDYWSAQIINDSEIDTVLVGDSLAMVMHGHPTTLNASVSLMALHTQAVAKGAPSKFIVGDMPFLSYRKDLTTNMTAVEKIMKAGAHAVKLEGAKGNLGFIRHVVESGVPVMGHIGLTPQSIHQLGGFKVQGKTPQEYEDILEQAEQLQTAGCFSIVLECVPSELAKEISEKLDIPTIGIGAGVHTDGQVLVLQDMLGMNNKFAPKFLKKYLNGYDLLLGALNDYHEDVVAEKFPTDKESYS
ncbi:MAG: 3-methyl-2-oxobutanoate hydroxymethyltransferase [Oligoflexia bacterium]|nr:MAG: 3-methyl-2-oxobutanoate hydroxymethyltransferase [Oligoflexia bacterium]